MKWNPLSESGHLLVRNLHCESRAFFGRRRKLITTLRAIVSLGEPAAIPLIMPFLFEDDPKVAEQAARAIDAIYERVGPHLLPSLDESIRRESRWLWPSNRAGKPREDAVRYLTNVPSCASSLGSITCHGNGYLREAAIVRLDREIHSGEEIPFLLIRIDDWVASVRQTAERALERRITASNSRYFRQSLAMISRLKLRHRASDSPLLQRIEDLLRTDVSALVDHVLRSDERSERRYGLTLALESVAGCQTEKRNEILFQIISSKDPATRLQAANWLTKASTMPDLQLHFLSRLLDDRFFSIRRVALAWCAVRAPQTCLGKIRNALLDESYAVRSIAHFHLPRLENCNVLNFYREALPTCEPRNLKAVLCGLSETGSSEDAELILPFFESQKPKIATAALGGLAKLSPKAHFELFVEALQSPSRKISRQARINLGHQASIITAPRLLEIFEGSGHEHVRNHALSLINELPKWQKLPLLIKIQSEWQDDTGREAKTHLNNWLHTYNATHQIRPLKKEIDALRDAVERYGASLDQRLESEFRNLARISS